MDLKEISTGEILELFGYDCRKMSCKECIFNNYGKQREKLKEKYGAHCGATIIRNVVREVTQNYEHTEAPM